MKEKIIQPVSTDTIIVSIMITRRTQQAVFGNDVWIPTSQILNMPDFEGLNTVFDMEIPEWLAIEKELI